MSHSHRKENLILTSLPIPLATIADTLYQEAHSTAVILSLTDIRNQTKHSRAHWLHEKELIQLKTFSYEKRHREWLGGRICAKQGLRIFLRQKRNSSFLPSHHSVQVAAEKSGRPYFSTLEGIDITLPELSISHSKEYAAALTSQFHCGIDIQYPADNLLKVVNRFATTNEEKLLNDSLGQHSKLSRLAMLWAGKEALKKMLSPNGMPGFHDIILKTIIKKNAQDSIFIFSRNDSAQKSFSVAVGMLLDNGYSLALCCDSPNTQ